MTTHDTGTPRTEADLLENFFQDGQGNNSITAQDMRDFVASTRYFQPLGWEFRFDSEYGDGVGMNNPPNTLLAPTWEKVTFTANTGEDLRYPLTFPEIWDNTNQKLILKDETPGSEFSFANGFGIVRLSCLGSYTGGTIPHIDLEVDVGTDPVAIGGGTDSNVIYQDSSSFAKGTGLTQAFNWIIPLFAGTDFVNNGAQFFIRSHTADCTVWQFTLTAGAIMVPGPAGI